MKYIPEDIRKLMISFLVSLLLVAAAIVLMIFRPLRTAGIVLGIISIVCGTVFVVLMISRTKKDQKEINNKMEK